MEEKGKITVYDPSMAKKIAEMFNAFNEIWIQLQDGGLYSYTIAATPDAFVATATGNIDDDGVNDIWTINDACDLINTSDDANLP